MGTKLSKLKVKVGASGKKKKKGISPFEDPKLTNVADQHGPPYRAGWKGLPMDQTTIQQAVSQNTSTENNLNLMEIFLVLSEIFSKILNVLISHTDYCFHKW